MKTNWESYLERCLKKPGFRREFYKAQVQDVFDDLRFENRDLKGRLASIRYIIKRASHDPETMALVRDMLDLRKPWRRR